MLKKAFIAACMAVIVSLVIGRLSPSPSPGSDYTQDTVKYTVSEYKGMVAVFRVNETRPIHVLYSYIDALPADMANQIQEGIPVHNEKELVKILERFSS